MSEYNELLSYLSNTLPHISMWVIYGDFNTDLLLLSALAEYFIDILMLHCLYPTILYSQDPYQRLY